MTSNSLLIIFSRPPVLGNVKQRLAREIGDVAALEIHEKLFERTLEIARQSGFENKIYLAAEPPQDFPHQYNIQSGDDLGERMAEAMEVELNEKQKVCLIGSDCINLQAADIIRAFKLLDKNDLVLGPAEDGGFYLIGFRNEVVDDIFIDIEWGTETVLDDTLKNAKNLFLETALLETRKDIDTVKDLPPSWMI